MFGATIEIGDNLLQLALAAITVANTVLIYRRTRELKPNSGKSIHDKVDKLYRVVAATDRANDSQIPEEQIEQERLP